MGAFFGSILVRSGNSDAVQNAVRIVAEELACKFLIGPPIDGWISLFPENDQNSDISAQLAKHLRDDLLQLMVHDDDIFLYFFYRNRALADRYDSYPDYFEGMGDNVPLSAEEKQKLRGRPEVFADLLPTPSSLKKLKALLAADHEKYTFESERLTEFVELLGLPNAVGSYDLFTEAQPGEVEEFDIQNWEAFIRIEPSAESIQERQKREEEAKASVPPAELAAAFCIFAKEKKDAGELETALAVFTTAIDADRTHAAAYSGRGGVKKALGDLTGALADYDKALELHPGSAPTFSNRGLLKKALGDLAGAMADFNEAIRIKPDLAAAYGNRGQVQHMKQQWDAALRDFDKAIELNPQSATLYNNRATLKRSKGDIDGALIDFDKALALDSSSAPAFNNRGELKRSRRDFEGALADFNRAIELKPNLAQAYNNRGILQHSKGNMEAALADLTKAIELKPGEAQFHLNRGDLFRTKKDFDAALRDYDRALELKPDFAEALNNRGEAKRLKGNSDGALADFEKAIALKPGLAAAYNNRGFIMRSRGGLEEPLADFNKAIELQPDFFAAYLNRANVKRLMDNPDGAIADYNRAIELKPNVAKAYNGRANARRLKADWDGAIADYTKATELDSAYGKSEVALSFSGTKKSKKPKARSSRKKIPATENALVLRTDFSDETAWESICEAIRAEYEMGFAANVDFVTDAKFKNVNAEQLATHLPEDYPFSFAFIIDSLAMKQPDYAILAVDLQSEPARTVRVVPSAVWAIENNLSISNMDFDDFVNAVGEDGVFRGL